jgi:hypothetical protein
VEIAAWPRWRALRDVWGMGRPSPAYTPKAPAQGVLYQVVRERESSLIAFPCTAGDHGDVDVTRMGSYASAEALLR